MTAKNEIEAQQPYELFGFAKVHGLPVTVARAIIDRFGVDRLGADAAAVEASFSIAEGHKGPEGS